MRSLDQNIEMLGNIKLQIILLETPIIELSFLYHSVVHSSVQLFQA